jgi:hypothetical protein
MLTTASHHLYDLLIRLDTAERSELSRQAAQARHARSEPRRQTQSNPPTALDSLVGSSESLCKNPPALVTVGEDYRKDDQFNVCSLF